MRPRGAEHLTAFIVLLQEEVETTCTNQTLIAEHVVDAPDVTGLVGTRLRMVLFYS